MITGIICLIGFAIGSVYVTPGGQAILALVDYFGGGFIIFVLYLVGLYFNTSNSNFYTVNS